MQTGAIIIASGSTNLDDETFTSKPCSYYSIKEIAVSTHYLMLAYGQNTQFKRVSQSLILSEAFVGSSQLPPNIITLFQTSFAVFKILKLGRVYVRYRRGWGCHMRGYGSDTVQFEPPLTLCTFRLSLHLKSNGRRCDHEKVCNLHKS